ncbi:MAG: hypothetical protein HC819_00140 [Cyclobacteriaceae bacterium]|nr:hypothetical protein [Cyclobacteriaceae bacterium]
MEKNGERRRGDIRQMGDNVYGLAVHAEEITCMGMGGVMNAKKAGMNRLF